MVVKVLKVDDNGKIRLSRKAAFGVDPDDILNMRGEPCGGDARGPAAAAGARPRCA